MGIGLETDAILAYSVGLLILYLLGSSLIKVFKMPIKIIITIFVNSIIGGILLFAINIFAENFNFQIGVNPINAMIVGVLGIPGLIMLILLRLIL
ncbi:MAG: pro-sigmaK processing inhibitor BofA family protein [Eubacteriaceae bacterium]